MNLYLASQSQRRRDILTLLGLAFQSVDVALDEGRIIKRLVMTDIGEKAAYLAECKSRAAATAENGIYLSADTMVVLENEILGKPVNETDAEKMIRKLSGKTHRVITGVAVTNSSTDETRSGFSVTDVTFRPLTDTDCKWYLAHAAYMDKAGAYAIQEHGAVFVESINGCFYNVVGLPVQKTVNLLTELCGDWRIFLSPGMGT